MHANPTAITLRRVSNERMVEVTFYGPTLNKEGAIATYPREEIAAWVTKWLEIHAPIKRSEGT